MESRIQRQSQQQPRRQRRRMTKGDDNNNDNESTTTHSVHNPYAVRMVSSNHALVWRKLSQALPHTVADAKSGLVEHCSLKAPVGCLRCSLPPPAPAGCSRENVLPSPDHPTPAGSCRETESNLDPSILYSRAPAHFQIHGVRKLRIGK